MLTPRPHAARLLVADDHPVNLEVMLRQLELLGLSADLAEDGAAALASWRNRRHAIVLLDLHMPVLDGFGLADAIRREEAKRNLPRTKLIAVTADALKGEETRCFTAGIDGFLPKPISLDALARTLGRWIPELVPTAIRAKGAAGSLFDPEVLRGLFGVRYRSACSPEGELRRQRHARHSSNACCGEHRTACGLRTPVDGRRSHGGGEASGRTGGAGRNGSYFRRSADGAQRG